MEADHKINDTTGATASGTVSMFVSIYLILLGFFAVLNAISNQAVSRAGAAVESLTNEFKGKHQPNTRKINLLNDPRAAAPATEYADEIRSLLTAVVGMEVLHASSGGDLLRVRVPTSEVFEGDSSTLNEGFKGFLVQLARLIGNSDRGETRMAEFVIGTPHKDIGPVRNRYRDLALVRGGNIEKTISSSGVPARSIVTGVLDGDGGSIIAEFRTLYEGEEL
ncbi:MAG: hypothetical protein KAI28_12070 [Sphingomonadales bacterium]|nr:hypothetical protein [Sphingomonadales bacterium]